MRIAMNTSRLLLAFAIAGLNGCSAEPPPTPPTPPEEETQAAPVTLANTFRHVLHSDAIGQDFTVDVALPYVAPDGPLPVVYVTDGNSMFPIVANSARLLQLGGELPPIIIVGIGYVTTTTAEVLALRTRDLTPTPDPVYTEQARQGPMPLPEGIEPGGAAAFLDFIERDVKPFIAEHYPVKEDDATLVGDSLGGLFTLYALFNRTGDYQRYVAGSPSLWWNDKTLFADEALLADTTEDLDADLFISVGALEENPDNAEDWALMVTNMQAMASVLEERNYPSLRLTQHVFEGETHLSVIPATLSRGLRAVFARDVATPSAGTTAPGS